MGNGAFLTEDKKKCWFHFSEAIFVLTALKKQCVVLELSTACKVSLL